jgi:predicted lipoprotein with Yx(FWY)xxD motif
VKRTGAATTWMVAAVLPAVVGSGCSNTTNKPSSAVPSQSGITPASSGPSSGTAATVAVARSKLGGILVGAGGRTPCPFEADTSATSTCNGSCAAAAPPRTTAGAPQAGQGVKASLLGTSKRADNTTRVTYYGHPLYYYAGGATAGDTDGEDLSQFGAKRHVLSAFGNQIESG